MDVSGTMMGDLMGIMYDGDMKEILDSDDSIETQIIFVKTRISSLYDRIHQLQECIYSYQKRVVENGEKIKAAGETESKLREKLDKKSHECYRLKIRVDEHVCNLWAQSKANEGRRQELTVLQEKFTKIKALLISGLPKKTLACDMRKTIADIMAVVTVPPESATEQVEA